MSGEVQERLHVRHLCHVVDLGNLRDADNCSSRVTKTWF